MTDTRLRSTRPAEQTTVIVLLGLAGVACAVTGLLVLASPTASAEQLGYAFVGPTGETEFRTFYGGFYAGIGAFLLVSARKEPLRAGAVAFLSLSATAAIPVRMYGILLFGSTDLVTYGLLFGELLYAGAGWIGWYCVVNHEDSNPESIDST
ncbi:MAG: DUF4345 domain-containing protein [Halobaculum sp.]